MGFINKNWKNVEKENNRIVMAGRLGVIVKHLKKNSDAIEISTH